MYFNYWQHASSTLLHTDSSNATDSMLNLAIKQSQKSCEESDKQCRHTQSVNDICFYHSWSYINKVYLYSALNIYMYSCSHEVPRSNRNVFTCHLNSVKTDLATVVRVEGHYSRDLQLKSFYSRICFVFMRPHLVTSCMPDKFNSC